MAIPFQIALAIDDARRSLVMEENTRSTEDAGIEIIESRAA